MSRDDAVARWQDAVGDNEPGVRESNAIVIAYRQVIDSGTIPGRRTKPCPATMNVLSTMKRRLAIKNGFQFVSHPRPSAKSAVILFCLLSRPGR
jgi:hypothetical protein